ncbi:PspA/IM30 family protein [Actinomyces bowdenii]|uniref:PspA/IM30 family protein n=1 Tax=Actinomyces bowdenii TaxID=131109 RepID=UPI00214C0966|nr:PspA/IM30 family protein [Actinomyces bowdenii]MCR2052697.1 PspA/IM30 family protein [Actinomyces bowdenii]
MAEKQSILGRIAQLTRANINALLDRAEDPEKMLNQLVRDYTASIAEARDAVAQTIGNLRLAEKDRDEDVAAARDWGNKALAASRKADQMRAAGDSAGADKWDSLAKIALTKQITAENEVKAAEPMIASQRQVVDQLKTGLQQMEVKLGELQSRRDQLIARQKTAEAQVKVQGAIRSINVMDPTSELARYEDQVRRVEAQAAGQMELAGSSLESQFAELESSSAQLEAEARLAALKAGSSPALQAAPAAPAQITDGDVDAAFEALKAQGQGAPQANGQAQPQAWPQQDDQSSY